MAILGIAAGVSLMPPQALGDRPVVIEAWRTSPFHRVTSGATGQPIPCLCLYKGRQFRVGERVCMQTPNGIVLTRCDMLLNNTTWVPTDEACTVSMRQPPLPQSRKS